MNVSDINASVPGGLTVSPVKQDQRLALFLYGWIQPGSFLPNFLSDLKTLKWIALNPNK